MSRFVLLFHNRIVKHFKELSCMDVSGSSCLAALQESVLSDEDPCHRSRCGRWANMQMSLPELSLA